MRKVFETLCLLFAITTFLLIESCASSYKAINPATVKYNGTSESEGVIFEYKYGVLQESGNSKYANKEIKKGLQVVSIKVTNNSEKAISFAEDIKVYSRNQIVLPVEPEIIQGQLKQPTPVYLLYGLLWLTISKCENDDCNNTPLPIGLPIAIGNMVVAGTANENFLAELKHHNLLTKKIEPGETAFGLMGIKSTGYGALTIKVD